MSPLRAVIVGWVLMLLAAAPGTSAACTSSTSVFTLTAVSQPQCLRSEMGVQWSKMIVSQIPDCSYTINGTWKDTGDFSQNHVGPYQFPTSSANITYTGLSGGTRQWTSTEYVDPIQISSPYGSFDSSGKAVTVYNGDDFAGLTTTLQVGLPPYTQGPFGITANSPGNYTIKQLGPNAMTVTQPTTGCTYTYTLTSGAFAGLQPTACKAGSAACPTTCGTGMYKQAQSGPAQGTSVCAFCPAGTYATGGGCQPCASGTASMAAGSTACAACPGALVPGIGQAACVPCAPRTYGYYSGILTAYGGAVNNTIFTGGTKCNALQCPTNTLAAPITNVCFGAVNGDLCQAAPSNECKGSPAALPKGGAALVLQSADVSAAACAAGLSGLAQWLKGRVTWMGYDMSLSASNTPYNGINYPPYANWGLNWAAAGDAKTGPMLGYPICGNAHGGPGSQPALTQQAELLTSRAFLFATILNQNYTAGSVQQWQSGYNPVGWGVMATPGAQQGTVVTKWFQDRGIGSCGLTPLSAAGVRPGVCTLTFKVTAGSVLGVSAGSGAACPTGMYAVKQASGATSCLMCGPGTYVSGSGCKLCQGKTYSDVWGATSCKQCANPYPGSFNYPGAPPESNTYCYSSSG